MTTAMSNGTTTWSNITMASSTTVPTRVYDARGAMLFTIVTVLVYGICIVAFIAGHLRRRRHSKEEESQIAKYLKRADEIRRQGVKDDVLRLRSQLLAGSVIVTNQNSERRKSRVERAKQYILNDINCAGLERTPSAESVVLPACTIPAPCSDADDNEISTPALLEVLISPPTSDSVFLTHKDEQYKSNSDGSGDDSVSESRLFIQTQGGGLSRFSLHASLEQSIINGNPARPLNAEQNDSPEGSPDFNKSRNYRSRRRGGVLTVPLSMGPQG